MEWFGLLGPDMKSATPTVIDPLVRIMAQPYTKQIIQATAKEVAEKVAQRKQDVLNSTNAALQSTGIPLKRKADPDEDYFMDEMGVPLKKLKV